MQDIMKSDMGLITISNDSSPTVTTLGGLHKLQQIIDTYSSIGLLNLRRHVGFTANNCMIAL